MSPKKNLLLEKIAKLLDKSKSAKEIGNLEEAEVFMLGVNNLLMKHNLAMVDIENLERKTKTSDDLIETGHSDGIKFDQHWQLDLIDAICDYNLCKGLYKTKFYPTATIIGKPDNIEVVKYLYDYLNVALQQLSVKRWKDHMVEVKEKFTFQTVFGDDATRDKIYESLCDILQGTRARWRLRKEDIHRSEIVSTLYSYKWEIPVKSLGILPSRDQWIRSWLQGSATGVRAKFSEEERKMVVDNSNVTTLVVQNKEQIDKFIKQKHSNLGYLSGPRNSTYDSARHDGYHHGKNIQINKAVGETSSKTAIE